MFDEPISHSELDAALRRARHDLKTPIAVLKGYVDMMLRGMGGDPSPTARRYLERMSDAVRKELALLDRFLASPDALLSGGPPLSERPSISPAEQLQPLVTREPG